jgi:hypothetical protein
MMQTWIDPMVEAPKPMDDYPSRSTRVLVCWENGRMEIAQAEFWENGSRRKWVVVENRGETSFPMENTRWMHLPPRW